MKEAKEHKKMAKRYKESEEAQKIQNKRLYDGSHEEQSWVDLGENINKSQLWESTQIDDYLDSVQQDSEML